MVDIYLIIILPVSDESPTQYTNTELVTAPALIFQDALSLCVCYSQKLTETCQRPVDPPVAPSGASHEVSPVASLK